MTEVWVVSNPSLNAVGCPHPRPNPAEGRNDLQVDGGDFAVFTDEEMRLWQLSPSFRNLVDRKRIQVEKTTLDRLPKRKKQIPSSLKPENQYDHQVAREIAFGPEEIEDVQMARINLFKDGDSDVGWVPDADTSYLKGRHIKLLRAAEWYLEQVADLTSSQKKRLRAVKQQIKSIEHML